MPYNTLDKRRAYYKQYAVDHAAEATKRSKQWYLDNKARHTAGCVRRNKEWNEWARIHEPKTLMLRRTRNTVKARGLECTITEEDFDIPEVCPILLIPLQMNRGNPKDNSPSLDRLDNKLGYVPGNVRVISFRANRLKSSMSFEEIERLHKYVSQK